MRSALLSVFLFFMAISVGYAGNVHSVGIANGNYSFDTVRTAGADLARLSDALNDNNIKIRSFEDQKRSDITLLLDKIVEQANKVPDAVYLIYLKGHGWSDGRSTFFVGIDANAKNYVDYSVNISDFVRLMSLSKARAVILIFDACRNSPDGGVLGAELGPGKLSPDIIGETAFLFLYSAQPGQRSDEGMEGISPFGEALSTAIYESDGQPVSAIFGRAVSRTMANGPGMGVKIPSRPFFENSSTGQIFLSAKSARAQIFAGDSILGFDLASYAVPFPEEVVDDDPDYNLVGYRIPGDFTPEHLVEVARNGAYGDDEYDVKEADKENFLKSTVVRRIRAFETEDRSYFLVRSYDMFFCGATGNCTTWFVEVTRSAEPKIKVLASVSAVRFYAIPAQTEFGDATLFIIVTWGERDTEVMKYGRDYSDRDFDDPISESVLNYEVR